MNVRVLFVTILSLPLGGLLAASALTQTAPDSETAKQATALVSASCVKCHDSTRKAGGIDFTTRATASLAFSVEKPNAAESSRFVRAPREGRMPPTGKLSEAQITLLTKWASEGSTYPTPRLQAAAEATPPRKSLWSFQPVRRTAIPSTKYDALSTNPVDHFIFDKLVKQGLKPSPLADRLTLLRRVTFDLTGLPPTLQEVDVFLSDKSPNAYEKVVDRLLASPAYGERWGRHWLDVVRYGESNGYEQNHLRSNAWPYRDYVIHAFNADKPYTQFVAEQLAGDVTAKDDPDAQAATGFLVAGVHDTVGIQTEEGTRQQRSNDLDDIVATTGAAFLGLTIGCARCHDHKFDPIPQRDYYRLMAVFAGVRHGERALTSPAQQEKMNHEHAQLEQQIGEKTTELNTLDSAAREVVLRSRGLPRESRPAVSARQNTDEFAPVEARFVRFTIIATRDKAEPCIDELQIFAPNSEKNLALASRGSKASASSLLPGFAVHQISHLNDGKFGNEFSWISAIPGTGWAQIELPQREIIGRVVWSRDGAEIPRFDDRLASSYRIEVSDDGTVWKTVSTEVGRAGSSDYIHPDVLLQAMTPEQRTKREVANQALTTLKNQLLALDQSARAYVGQFSPPDPIYVLRRGDVMQQLDIVLPGALSQCAANGLSSNLIASPVTPEPERRLALARWITDSRNPLTARVLVNRVWQHHFGRGLVGTPSDFGNNGEKPSHPELLDWLSATFVAKDEGERMKDKNGSTSSLTPHSSSLAFGWRLKPLHRLLVTSYTYRQAGVATKEGMTTDAGNRLLWRMPLRRLEAESVRDAILATSGKLDRKMGGPSFRLYKYNVVNVAIYEPLEQFGPETWRRSVYQQAARGIHEDLLGAFDCPESSQRAPRRESTTTALQALALLNGPFTEQQANFFAEHVKEQAGTSAGEQARAAFRLAFGRAPTIEEQQAAVQLIRKQGLTDLCRALFNANEFLYF